MSELHFRNLTIKGFRGIKELTIPQLGRVNLITGKNNTGKSSVLEALRLFANNADTSVILNILELREEDSDRPKDTNRGVFYMEGMTSMSALFHGFPGSLEETNPIAISSMNKSGPMILELDVSEASDVFDLDRGNTVFQGQPVLLERSEPGLALIVKTEDDTRIQPLGVGYISWFPSSHGYPLGSIPSRVPCVLVRPDSGERTDRLANQWDSILLTDKEQDVTDALRIIDSRIDAVSVIGIQRHRAHRRAIVRAKGIPRPVPLRSFGDGMNRLFGIALSLVSAGSGILLIDEFENGLHYSVQPDVWRMIFNMSERLNIQVFATTHSKDTVHSFQKAAAESAEEAMHIKLTRRGDTIFAVDSDKDELEIATRHDIEVR